MLKKQYKIFIAVFVLLAVIGAFWSKGHYYSYNTESLSKRQFTVTKQENNASESTPLVFSFSNGNSVLTTAEGISPEDINVTYFYGDGATVDSASAADFSYTNDMSGTIVAVAPEMQLDINGDGKEETVLACAKSQTTNSQSYAEYAWINHCFGDESIPVEVSYYGSGTSSTYMDLLVNGAPYTGMIHIQSNSGLDTDMEITEGALAGLSIDVIRQGFTVTINDSDNDRVLVGSYIAEDYTLFGTAALDNFKSIALLVLLIIGGSVLISLFRKAAVRSISPNSV